MITIRIEVTASTLAAAERLMREKLGDCARGQRWSKGYRAHGAEEYQFMVQGDAPDFPGEAGERAERRGVQWIG